MCSTSLETPTSLIVTVDLRPGTLFDGRYEIQAPLGRGGMGMVYRAHDRTLDELVAIKVLRPEYAEDPQMAERFKSEIKLARKVRHRNVCAIHDFGEDRGVLYISMELIDGVDLKHVLRDRGALPPEEAYDISIQVAEGLEAAHATGIIHRDLKTPNIMVDKAGVARLMDFGIAKRQQAGGTATATGVVLGTPEYMSPEQAQGQRVDVRSDVYALGIVIYEIFTGDVPFRGETPISTILKHLHDPPSLDNSKLPTTLQPVLRKALAKEAAARYPSARAVADALREARSPSLRQQPIATAVLQAPTLPRQRPPAVGPKSLAARVGLVLIPLAAVGFGVLLWRSRETGSESPAATAAKEPMATTPTPAPTPTTSVEPVERSPVTTTTRSRPAPAATPRSTPPPAAAAPLPSPSTVLSTPSTTLAPAPATTSPPPPTTTLALEPGELQIAVRPWAEVRVDGRALGTTPLDKISLSAGTHSVVLQHPSYEPMSRTITIRPGELTRLVVDLSSEATPRRD